MKKYIMALLVVIGGLFLLRAKAGLSNAHWSLRSEIAAYHQNAAQRVGELAVELSLPILDPESRGAYKQRLRGLQEPFSRMNDNEEIMILDLLADHWNWGCQEAIRRGEAFSAGHGNESALAILRTETFYEQIVAMEEDLRTIDQLTYGLKSGGKAPWEGLGKVRTSFNERKARMEEILARFTRN